MSERNAFLKALEENEDDTLTRLVYADWLDEHGQAERAEFIRTQIQVEGLAEEDPRYPPLRAREAVD